MDRALIRKKAKQEYKKLMKTTPKAQRMPFAQAFPMLKSILEGKFGAGAEDNQAQIQPEDEALIQSMMEEEPHQHGPNCNHDHGDVVEIAI